MAALRYEGSTSTFSRVRPGVIIKSPKQVWKESSSYNELTQKIAYNFYVERQILQRLGNHPRIVKLVLFAILVVFN